jgi:hypothetical protein
MGSAEDLINHGQDRRRLRHLPRFRADRAGGLGRAADRIDDAQQYMPMSSEWVHLDLVVNADIVKPSDITSWRDLPDPKYKDKIIALMKEIVLSHQAPIPD